MMTATPPPAAPPAFIRIDAVHKDYVIGGQHVRALDGTSLAVFAGAFVALVGPSGSGKSTLLHILGGLDRPTAGTVTVGGEEITALTPKALCKYRQRQLGFVFQKFNLLGTHTARENVEFPLLFAGVPEPERRARALRALEAVGLGDRLDHRPGELSGGQQQRVAIARAVITDAPIILADEPTGNLDSESGNSIMQLLSDLHHLGRTVIVVTHDPRMTRFATQTVRMLDGHIVDEQVS
jgi:ABC-type lipoprotein export system ATPase subunit